MTLPTIDDDIRDEPATAADDDARPDHGFPRMHITPQPTPEQAAAIRATLETVRSRRRAGLANEHPGAWRRAAIEDARRPPEPPLWTER